MLFRHMNKFIVFFTVFLGRNVVIQADMAKAYDMLSADSSSNPSQICLLLVMTGFDLSIFV